MLQRFSHRSAFERHASPRRSLTRAENDLRALAHTSQLYLSSQDAKDQIRTRHSMREREAQAYQALSESIVRDRPTDPPGRVVVTPAPSRLRTAGYLLLALAAGYGVALYFLWVLNKYLEVVQ